MPLSVTSLNLMCDECCLVCIHYAIFKDYKKKKKTQYISKCLICNHKEATTVGKSTTKL